MRRSASCLVWTGLSCAAMVVLGGACERGPDPLRQRGPLAVLTGRVRLADGAQLPAYAAADLARRALHGERTADVPAQCADANAHALTPVALSAGGLLSNIAIAASDFTHVKERQPVTHHVTIAGCTLLPRMITAMVGDHVVVENLDAFGFDPWVGPALSGKRLAHGERLTDTLTQGVASIACSPRAPCGRTDLVVLYHPISAVTDANGAFRIENFPAREVVRVSAWHPLFEESETFVWVEPSQRAEIELILTPKKRFVAASSAAAH